MLKRRGAAHAKTISWGMFYILNNGEVPDIFGGKCMEGVNS